MVTNVNKYRQELVKNVLGLVTWEKVNGKTIVQKKKKLNRLGNSDDEFIHNLTSIYWVWAIYQAWYKTNFSAWEITILGCWGHNDWVSGKTGHGIRESTQICDNLHNENRDHLLKMVYNEKELLRAKLQPSLYLRGM